MKRRLVYGLLLALLAIGLPDSLAAQTNPGNSIAGKFKSAIIDMAKGLIDITKEIKTVEDAEKAEPKIKGMMGKLTEVLVELNANVDNLTDEEVTELESFEALVNDPEVSEWGEKAEAAVGALKEKNPEAADKLEELTRNNSVEFMGAMMAVVQKIQERIQGSVEGDEFVPQEQEEGEGY